MRRMWTVMTTGVLTLALTGGVAFAATAPPNPGVQIGSWITTNVNALFVPLLAAVSLYYLAKRQFTKFLSFAAFAVLVSLVVFAGTEFKDAAVGFARFLIGK